MGQWSYFDLLNGRQEENDKLSSTGRTDQLMFISLMLVSIDNELGHVGRFVVHQSLSLN